MKYYIRILFFIVLLPSYLYSDIAMHLKATIVNGDCTQDEARLLAESVVNRIGMKLDDYKGIELCFSNIYLTKVYIVSFNSIRVIINSQNKEIVGLINSSVGDINKLSQLFKKDSVDIEFAKGRLGSLLMTLGIRLDEGSFEYSYKDKIDIMKEDLLGAVWEFRKKKIVGELQSLDSDLIFSFDAVDGTVRSFMCGYFFSELDMKTISIDKFNSKSIALSISTNDAIIDDGHIFVLNPFIYSIPMPSYKPTLYWVFKTVTPKKFIIVDAVTGGSNILNANFSF